MNNRAERFNPHLYYYVQYQLNLRRMTVSQLARDLGLSLGHVQRVLWGERRSPRVRTKLADILGFDPLAPDFTGYSGHMPLDGEAASPSQSCHRDQ